MRRTVFATTLMLCMVFSSESRADSPRSAGRLPRVYSSIARSGASGRSLAIAHRSYTPRYRRSGRSIFDGARQFPAHSHSHSHRHRRHHGGGHFHFPYRSFGYGSSYSSFGGFYGLGYGNSFGTGIFGYAGYGPVYGYAPTAPVLIQPDPRWIGGNAFRNNVLNDALRENRQRWGDPLIVEPLPQAAKWPVKTSTPQAKLRSLRAQAHGDMWFRKQEYHHAYSKYKQSISHTEDRSEPRFRLAMTLTALRSYSLAVKHLKRGLELDPSWPTAGESLTKIFGPDNELAKTSIIHKVVLWVKEDIRDPDRLFLLGVLLHFNDDADRAKTLLETAYRLAGTGDHLVAFLRSAAPEQPVGEKPPVPPRPDADNPPPPQPGGLSLPAPQKSSTKPGRRAPAPAQSRPETKQPEGPRLPPLPAP